MVVGAGALGLSTALGCALAGRSVAVLERHAAGSQASGRAAGLFKSVQADELRTRLARRSIDRAITFADWAGTPLAVARHGSFLIARTGRHREFLSRELQQSRRWGADVREATRAQLAGGLGYYRPGGDDFALWCPEDIYIDEPASLIQALLAACRRHGAVVAEHEPVIGISVTAGRVRGVETERRSIAAPVVVDAAGAWARQVAAGAGIYVPMVPTRHQLLITEPIEGVRPDLPIVRIMDAAVYVRPCWGGFLVGGYETDPMPFDMAQLPTTFSIADTPLDLGVLLRLVKQVHDQFPALREPSIRVHRGGIPTMTPDGQHLVGPVPGADGFFIASGCNVAGLSIAPAIGEVLAQWIVDGQPSQDLAPMSMARFGPEWTDERRLREATAWEYWHFYYPRGR